MLKKLLFIFFLALLFATVSVTPVFAGEVDILIKKLVEKGILTPSDADEILKEVKEAAKQERAAVVKETAEAIKKDKTIVLTDLPDWIRKTKFKGDFRLRYQLNDMHARPDRHRGRYRMRLGFVTEVIDKIHVGFGLATGGNNPRSTNQTMMDSFDTPDCRVDYAYASYTPWDWLTLIGGKFKNPIWRTSGLLWDSDIRPEGAAAILNYKAGSAVDLFLNTGAWIIDERSGDESDPIMFVAQPGYKLKLGKSAYFKNAAIMYQFSNVEGNMLDYSSGTNTLTRSGALRNDYDAVGVTGELGLNTGFDYIPFFALFSEYITNRKASDSDDGYLVGLKFGDKKVKERSQWQFQAMYRRLERDAWLDCFPNADVYSGGTNIKGYNAGVKYGLTRNVTFDLNYFYMKMLTGSSMSDEVLQVDMNFKF